MRYDTPEQRRAYDHVFRAIKRGALIRQPCEVCGQFGRDAHHDDYDKPLDVRWFCRSHHMAQHGKLPKVRKLLKRYQGYEPVPVRIYRP